MNLPKINGGAITSNESPAVVRMSSDTVENVLACREFMNRRNLSGAQSGFFYRPGPVTRIPVCAGKPKARPRPNRSATPQANSVASLVLKKILCPCLAALVLGKALSYVAELSTFVLFLLR